MIWWWPAIFIFGLGLFGCSIPFYQNEMDELPDTQQATRAYAPSPFEEFNPEEPAAANTTASPNSSVEELSGQGPLSLERIKKLARQYNPTLLQAWSQVEGERAKALQAGLYPNPIGGYIGDQINAQKTIGEFQGGFLQQEIVTAGKLELSRQKYLARASAAELQALAQEYRVMNALLIQYYRIIGFQDRLGIQQELLKSWQDELATMNERFNVGQANEANVRRARVQLHRQRLTVQMAQNDLQLEQERLLTLVGIPLPVESISGTLSENLPPLQFDASLQRILQQSPELGLANANVRSDQIMVKREKVEPIPNINIRGSAGRNYIETQTVYGLMAFIEIPIFDQNQGTIHQAQADLRFQQAEVTRTKLRLRRSLADQFQQYLTALQHVQTYREAILPEAEERYRTQLESYQADRESWPAVLEAQLDFFMLRLEYIDQLIAWRTARVAIEGFLLVEGLQTPGGVTPLGPLDANPKPR